MASQENACACGTLSPGIMARKPFREMLSTKYDTPWLKFGLVPVE